MHLIGIDPAEIVEKELRGARFNIGVLPYFKRQEIEAISVQYGGDDQGKNVGLLIKAFEESVRWGIKGHSNFKFKDGRDIPFRTKKVIDGGKEYNIVSDETFAIYSATGIVTELSALIAGLNILSSDEKKT